jgi:hypothetical protein
LIIYKIFLGHQITQFSHNYLQPAVGRFPHPIRRFSIGPRRRLSHLRVMKKIAYVLTTALLAIGCWSCTNNKAASASPQGDKTAAATTFSPAPASGDLFTATIDGQSYSSKASTGLDNIGSNQIADDKQPYVSFNLADVKSADDSKTTRSFRMVTVNKPATVHLTKEIEIPNYGIQLEYLDGDFSQYMAQDMTLNITEVSAARLKGNFSGKMYANTASSVKKFIMVDAKFDIPIAP